MNKIKTTIVYLILIAMHSLRVNAQTSMLCPYVALPYECCWTDYGLTDYFEQDLQNVQEFINGQPGNYVESWQGAGTIRINYTTPQMSDHSMNNNCVQQADLDACIANDFAEWTSICPGMFIVTKVSSIAAGSTGINMQWSSTGTNFQAGKDANGNTTIAGGETDLGQATPTLGIINPQIYLNNSMSFNDQLIFTTCPQHCTTPTGDHAISICEVLLHEIGHAFGLEDLGSDPGYNGVPGTGENYPQGVMWGELQPVVTNPCPDKTLQDVDQCYFCKLYCPSNCATLGAPLPPGDTSMSFSVFPNPATVSFTVMYKSLEPYSSLSIEDIMGRKILQQNLTESEGSILETSDKLPAGAYIIRLQGSEHFVLKMLIIQ
jgi:hypothetical protein